jgi:hypothetical protein
MNDSGDTKTCPMCAETIRSAASVCPFCRNPQVKTDFKKRFEALMFLLPLPAAIVGALIWLNFLFGSGRSFEPNAEKLAATDATMNFSESTQGNFISTIGFIRNESPYPWKDVQIEVQYFDNNGNLVDTHSQIFQRLRLPAGATHAFRVRAAADKPKDAYASQKIYVRSATDPNSFK